MTRRRVATAAIAVAVLLLLCWLLVRKGAPPPEPTWSLAELPSAAPTPPPADVPPETPPSPPPPSNATTAPPPAAAPEPERRPPRRGLPTGALGADQAPAPGEEPRAAPTSPLRERLRVASPEELYRGLDRASPDELRGWLEDAEARARPEHRWLLSAPPGAPREQLLHLALLDQAIERHEALKARYGDRIPLPEAVTLAELNLAVAERGLNSPAAQREIDAELARALGSRPTLEQLDRLFAAARAELDRVTRPGPPPDDPLALALKQASAYYRVMALAALRLELGTGRRVPSLSPELTAGQPGGGMGGALEGR